MSMPMVETSRTTLSGAASRREDAFWNAVRSRDRAFDGAFVFAVRTTGVYCRPSCASRAAKREHVSFYPSAEMAARAGYRACKRCRPEKLGAPDPQVEAVRRACERIDLWFEHRHFEKQTRSHFKKGLIRFHYVSDSLRLTNPPN